MDQWEKLIKLFNSFKHNGISQYDGTVYHYTSPEGLKSIIDNSSLHATDLYYLNDASEGLYVLDLIEENINFLCDDEEWFKNNIKKAIDLAKYGKLETQIHSYSISFSMDSDSLEMWNYYTKGNSVQGYCIGFDVGTLADGIKIKILDKEGQLIDRSADKHLILFHGAVIYESDKQLEILKDIFSKFKKLCKEINDSNFQYISAEYAISKSLDYGKFFKAEAFKIEKEYRLVYATYLMPGESNSIKGIPYTESFKIKNGIFIPYQECIFEKKALREIKFSPSLHSDEAEASLNRYLKSQGLEVNINKSEIPLRY